MNSITSEPSYIFQSVNLTFCSFVSMKEHMSYLPHPDSPDKTLLRQETLVTVRGVPLTSYMESLIVNTGRTS